MAYNYIGLTNRVLKALNEVPLTDATFASAAGFHADVKDAVNQSIFDIYQYQDLEWPFAWDEFTTTLVVGQLAYSKDASAAKIDWDSFSIRRDDGNDIAYTKLNLLDYDSYRENQGIEDKNRDTDSYTFPRFVIRKPDNNFIISPSTDDDYTLDYEGFSYPTALSATTDAPSIPAQYEQVIVDKAMHYAYAFRDNVEQSGMALTNYMKGIVEMRRIEIPAAPYVRFSS